MPDGFDIKEIRKLLKDLAKTFKIGENLKILIKVISRQKISATEKNFALDALAFVLLPLVVVIAWLAHSFKEVVPLYLKLAFSSSIVCVLFSSMIDSQTEKRNNEIKEKDILLCKLNARLKEIEKKGSKDIF